VTAAAQLFLLPPVYPILDTDSLAALNVDARLAAEGLLEGGAEILQFRHKSFWSREVVETAKDIARLCASAGSLFVVNDRADYAALLARELNGDGNSRLGLHLGQEDMDPAEARLVTGTGIFIGFSTHNSRQMRAAIEEPVDYVAFGPVFGTRSKQRPDPEVGIAGLREVRALISRPLVAIGGITRENARYCLDAGADSIAVIADLLPQPCTRETLRDRMIEWRQRIRK
jgi:thiamine-phosphate pyrophosphorylase